MKPPKDTTKACSHPAGTFWWISAAGLCTAGEMGIYPGFPAPLLITCLFIQTYLFLQRSLALLVIHNFTFL